MANKKKIKVFLVVIFALTSMKNYGALSKQAQLQYQCDTPVSSYFFISYDTMEVQINKAIKESKSFESKSNNYDISAGILIKVGLNGRIRKVKCISYPEKMSKENKRIHKAIITKYFKSLKRVRPRLSNIDGKSFRVKEVIIFFMIDDCGYVKLNYSNSFKDGGASLLDCPFAI